MKDVLKIIECEGFTKEEAFADLHFNPIDPLVPRTNVTAAWKKEGSPIPGTVKFKRFMAEQVDLKVKNTPGHGVYIVLKPPVKDNRKKPFTIINNKTTGTREWKFIYQIREDEFDIKHLTSEDLPDEIDENEEILEIAITKPGLIVAECDNKTEALDKMKKLITDTHKSYSLIPVKVPDLASIAAYGIYTPSVKAKKGVFIACGINKEEL